MLKEPNIIKTLSNSFDEALQKANKMGQNGYRLGDVTITRGPKIVMLFIEVND